MNKKVLNVLGSILLAAGSVAACAGDGADSDDGGNGGTSGGGNTSGTTGGTSGTGGKAGGTGGTSGTTGGTSGTGGTGAPGGNGIALMPGGYYSNNGLKGYWFTASDSKKDGGASTIMPSDYSVQTKLCAQGTAAMVPDMDSYSKYWGVLIGWNVNQGDTPPAGATEPPIMNAPLTGSFTIGIAGTTVPSGLRFKVAVGADEYCAPLMAGSNTVAVADLKKSCWMTGGDAYAGQPVKDVAVQVTTNPDSATPYNFCITTFTYSK